MTPIAPAWYYNLAFTAAALGGGTSTPALCATLMTTLAGSVAGPAFAVAGDVTYTPPPASTSLSLSYKVDTSGAAISFMDPRNALADPSLSSAQTLALRFPSSWPGRTLAYGGADVYSVASTIVPDTLQAAVNVTLLVFATDSSGAVGAAALVIQVEAAVSAEDAANATLMNTFVSNAVAGLDVAANPYAAVSAAAALTSLLIPAGGSSGSGSGNSTVAAVSAGVLAAQQSAVQGLLGALSSASAYITASGNGGDASAPAVDDGTLTSFAGTLTALSADPSLLTAAAAASLAAAASNLLGAAVPVGGGGSVAPFPSAAAKGMASSLFNCLASGGSSGGSGSSVVTGGQGRRRMLGPAGNSSSSSGDAAAAAAAAALKDSLLASLRLLGAAMLRDASPGDAPLTVSVGPAGAFILDPRNASCASAAALGVSMAMATQRLSVDVVSLAAAGLSELGMTVANPLASLCGEGGSVGDGTTSPTIIVPAAILALQALAGLSFIDLQVIQWGASPDSELVGWADMQFILSSSASSDSTGSVTDANTTGGRRRLWETSGAASAAGPPASSRRRLQYDTPADGNATSGPDVTSPSLGVPLRDLFATRGLDAAVTSVNFNSRTGGAVGVDGAPAPFIITLPLRSPSYASVLEDGSVTYQPVVLPDPMELSFTCPHRRDASVRAGSLVPGVLEWPEAQAGVPTYATVVGVVNITFALNYSATPAVPPSQYDPPNIVPSGSGPAYRRVLLNGNSVEGPAGAWSPRNIYYTRSGSSSALMHSAASSPPSSSSSLFTRVMGRGRPLVPCGCSNRGAPPVTTTLPPLLPPWPPLPSPTRDWTARTPSSSPAAWWW